MHGGVDTYLVGCTVIHTGYRTPDLAVKRPKDLYMYIQFHNIRYLTTSHGIKPRPTLHDK